MGQYFDALKEAMTLVASQPNPIILGQSVRYGGTELRRALEHVPQEILLELPVFEDSQLGMATGLAMSGHTVLSCYPRWNFLGIAWNQLVEHLDKIPLFGNGFNPRVLIRVAVPRDTPMNPGPQHLGDFTSGFRDMLSTVVIHRLMGPHAVIRGYEKALESTRSTILVEYASLYDE